MTPEKPTSSTSGNAPIPEVVPIDADSLHQERLTVIGAVIEAIRPTPEEIAADEALMLRVARETRQNQIDSRRPDGN